MKRYSTKMKLRITTLDLRFRKLKRRVSFVSNYVKTIHYLQIQITYPSIAILKRRVSVLI